MKTFTMWEGRRGTTGLPAGARAHGARVCTACGGLSSQARDIGCEPLGRRGLDVGELNPRARGPRPPGAEGCLGSRAAKPSFYKNAKTSPCEGCQAGPVAGPNGSDHSHPPPSAGGTHRGRLCPQLRGSRHPPATPQTLCPQCRLGHAGQARGPGASAPVHVVLGVEEPALLADALRGEVGDGAEQAVHAQVLGVGQPVALGQPEVGDLQWSTGRGLSRRRAPRGRRPAPHGGAAAPGASGSRRHTGHTAAVPRAGWAGGRAAASA